LPRIAYAIHQESPMTASPDRSPRVDADTPADIHRDEDPIPLPEGQPGNDGSDPTPESDMESGLLKPLENTPVVRSPNANPLLEDEARGRGDDADPLGTRADTGVSPTTSVPEPGKRGPG
jgi:hypothetical protein